MKYLFTNGITILCYTEGQNLTLLKSVCIKHVIWRKGKVCLSGNERMRLEKTFCNFICFDVFQDTIEQPK